MVYSFFPSLKKEKSIYMVERREARTMNLR